MIAICKVVLGWIIIEPRIQFVKQPYSHSISCIRRDSAPVLIHPMEGIGIVGRQLVSRHGVAAILCVEEGIGILIRVASQNLIDNLFEPIFDRQEQDNYIE